MKTNLQLLQQLKEPYRSQAMANAECGPHNNHIQLWFNTIPDDHQDARMTLRRSFLFDQSKEGEKYWRNIAYAEDVTPFIEQV